MRWLFADPHNPDEAAYVTDTVAAIDHWWKEFQARIEKIENAFKPKSRYNLPKFMEETLQAIHPGLMWEFGPAVKQKDGYRLVITPESQRYLRPMVRTILERAPTLPNWEFYGYRVPETPELTIDTVTGRVGVDISGALVAASPASGRKIDLYFDFPGQETIEEDQARQAAFIATETLLGEQFLDNWIGEIGLLSDNPEPAIQPLPLARAQVAIATLVKAMYERLPTNRPQDISVEEGWANISLDPPEEMDDYPGRSDLVSATIHDVELFQAMHSGQPFASTCHSRVHEQFCYIKIDGTGVSENLVDFRSKLDQPLNKELLAANLGGVTGGGTGVRYVYIDLALTDLKRAVGIVRKVLNEHEVPERSWLLFHDDDLAEEWIGLHPHSPPPPEGPAVEAEEDGVEE